MSENALNSENNTEQELNPNETSVDKQVDTLEPKYKNVSILPLPTSLVNYRNKNLLMSAASLAAGLLFTATLRTWSAFII